MTSDQMSVKISDKYYIILDDHSEERKTETQ